MKRIWVSYVHVCTGRIEHRKKIDLVRWWNPVSKTSQHALQNLHVTNTQAYPYDYPWPKQETYDQVKTGLLVKSPLPLFHHSRPPSLHHHNVWLLLHLRRVTVPRVWLSVPTLRRWGTVSSLRLTIRRGRAPWRRICWIGHFRRTS